MLVPEIVQGHQVIVSGEGNNFHSWMSKTVISPSSESLSIFAGPPATSVICPRLWSGRVPSVDTSPQSSHRHSLTFPGAVCPLPWAPETLIPPGRFCSAQGTLSPCHLPNATLLPGDRGDPPRMGVPLSHPPLSVVLGLIPSVLIRAPL